MEINDPSGEVRPIAPPSEEARNLAQKQPSLEEMANIAIQIHPSAVLNTPRFNAMDALLVAYRKKPICYFELMFESETPNASFLWSQEFDDWLVHNAGLSYFVDIYYPYAMDGSPAIYDASEIPWGSKYFHRIVWYRPDTRHHALLERHRWRLIMTGKNWRHPYDEIIRGLNYGYPEDQVRSFSVQYLLKDEDGSYRTARSAEEYESSTNKVEEEEKERIMAEAKEYVRAKYQEYGFH
jgi:hypothetical protein